MKILKYAVLILYTIVVMTLSILPGGRGPKLGHMDKIGHFIAYFGMAVLVWQVVTTVRGRLIMAGAAVLFGVVLELVQHFVPGRDASVADAAANTLGIMSGCILMAVVGERLKTFLKSPDRV